jgi:hypothetical protein
MRCTVQVAEVRQVLFVSIFLRVYSSNDALHNETVSDIATLRCSTPIRRIVPEMSLFKVIVHGHAPHSFGAAVLVYSGETLSVE